MTYKITVQAVTYHTYFIDDDDHDGDDYTWAKAHTSNKMTEEFGWSSPGVKAEGFSVLTAAVSRRHGEWFENDDGDMVWVADPSEEP